MEFDNENSLVMSSRTETEIITVDITNNGQAPYSPKMDGRTKMSELPS